MAIAYDTSSTKTGTSEDLSWTHTPVGTPAGVLVFVSSPATSIAINGVTYGGVAMVEVDKSPIIHTSEDGSAAAYFLGAGIPSGAQTVIVDFEGTLGINRFAVCYTVTSDALVAVKVTDSSINSNSLLNPSAVLALEGMTCWVAQNFISGHDNVSSITPFANWTSTYEPDFGSVTGGWYRYNIVAADDVTFGWTQTAEDARCLTVALFETKYIMPTTEASFAVGSYDTDLLLSGIRYGNKSNCGTPGTGDLTWDHNPTKTPAGVLVGVVGPEGTDHVVGVTYGGVAMVEVTGSPLIKTAAEVGAVYLFFLGSGVPTGNQTIVVDTNNTAVVRQAACFTVTAASNIIVKNTVTISSDSVANPSANLALGGKNCFVAVVFISGQDAITGTTPLAGWSSGYEYDLGTTSMGMYSYGTVAGDDVTVGWTQTAEDAVCIAVALKQWESYTLLAEVNAITVSGVNVTLTKTTIAGYTLNVDTAVFAVADNISPVEDVTLVHGAPMPVTKQTYVVTDKDILLVYARIAFSVDTAVFVVADKDILLVRARIAFSVDTAVFVVADNISPIEDVLLVHGYPMVAETNEIEIVDTTATLYLAYTRIPLAADTNAITLITYEVELVHGYPMVAETNEIEIVDTTATLYLAYTRIPLSAETNAVTFITYEAELVHGYHLPVATRIFGFGSPIFVHFYFIHGYQLVIVGNPLDLAIVGDSVTLEKGGPQNTLFSVTTSEFEVTETTTRFKITEYTIPYDLTRFLTYEPMAGAIVNSVSSETTNEPATHAIMLEPNFSWQANEVAQHTLVIDLGEERGADGFTFIFHGAELQTPLVMGLTIDCAVSIDNVNWQSLTLRMDETGLSFTDTALVKYLIKTRVFWANSQITRYYGRYWRFTLKGTQPPSYNPPYNSRISMCWLHTYHSFERGAAFPVNDVMTYPIEKLPLAFGKRHNIGRNVNPMIHFSRTWLLTASDYITLMAVINNCNGTERPFLLTDIDQIRRLCYFASEPIDIDVIDTDLYRVTCQFTEIPIVKSEAYH